jgi:hypothetical protein
VILWAFSGESRKSSGLKNAYTDKFCKDKFKKINAESRVAICQGRAPANEHG